MLEFEKLFKSGRTPRLHPNGFIQLDLNEQRSMRLHVWPEIELPAQKTHHPIHDHSFDMASTVLTGALVNEVLVLGDGFGPVYQVFRGKKVGPEDTVLEPTEEFGRLTKTVQQTVTKGNSYSLDYGLFHNSIPSGLTATIMTKLNARNYNPRVLVPVGVAPDNEYRREQLGALVLWEQIHLALERA